jgi:hypothetical protein
MMAHAAGRTANAALTHHPTHQRTSEEGIGAYQQRTRRGNGVDPLGHAICTRAPVSGTANGHTGPAVADEASALPSPSNSIPLVIAAPMVQTETGLDLLV